MSNLLVVVLLVIGIGVYYVVNLLIRRRLTENFTDDRSLGLYDSHRFLMTSIMPGKVDIANLREKNPHHTDFYYVDPSAVTLEQTDPKVVSHRVSALDSRQKFTCIGPKHPIRQVIQQYQPYFYDQAEIINQYDFPFYRDWRYPERPIDPQFAINPEKYCEKNPQVYPCYRYFSKW